MADFSYTGDEENAELKKLNAAVIQNPDDFEAWETLVRSAESPEGGLNRNSSPQSISAVRDVYDRFLAKFPLLFGYWKKYGELEFTIAGSEAADMVYERGIASIGNSVDLWTTYCNFKSETSHDPDMIRELFERGANSVGLDFLAHPFWDKYIEFEERLEAYDKIFAILGRIIHIPLHQYARYFEHYRRLAHSRPVEELASADILAQYRTEIESNPDAATSSNAPFDMESQLRAKVDAYHLELFSRTQIETTKRWTYEQEIKRPYFHVTELDEPQLANWRKYLDFEESEGDYPRIVFLYERCLVTAAYYDDFWLRYARWMLAQPGKEEEVRNIYMRASCFYAPISRPAVRLQYARFEEMSGRVDVAQDIHQAILYNLPNHIETVVSWANLQRRHAGLDAAVAVYETQVALPDLDDQAKGALVAEWARLLWKAKGSADDARTLYQENVTWYLNVRAFWVNYLQFEIQQLVGDETDSKQHARIKQVYQTIRSKSTLSKEIIGELSQLYMEYLLEYGNKDAAKEYLQIDKEINGPTSIQTQSKNKPIEATANGNSTRY